MVIAIGASAPDVAGANLVGPEALVFFKVTCGTTKLATPAIERLALAYPGRVVGIGQDPQVDLDAFASAFGLSLPLVPDLEPYPASDAYGIVSAPTVVSISADGSVRRGGRVVGPRCVESGLGDPRGDARGRAGAGVRARGRAPQLQARVNDA